MAQPIYKVWMFKPKEAWFQLSQEEQKSLSAKIGEAFKKAGGKSVLPLCNSGWSSEQWPFFSLDEFPDIEAVQKESEDLNKLNWSQYIESMSLLGTKWEPPR